MITRRSFLAIVPVAPLVKMTFAPAEASATVAYVVTKIAPPNRYDNPAWALYDFWRSVYPEDRIDIDSVRRLADYYDEVVQPASV